MIQDGWFDRTKYMNIFEKCVNLENVIVLDDCSYFKKDLFKNCRKLKRVHYNSGKEESLLIKLEIPSDTQKITKEKNIYSYV